jgi:hypothetical protein
VDAGTKELLGDSPFYFALRNDAFMVGMGENGLGALKEALAAKPAAAPPLRLELSLSHLPRLQERLAKRFKRDPKAVAAAAKKAFATKGSDKVRLTVEGGKSLRLSVKVHTQVIAFVGRLAAGDAEEKEKE